jgi:predicted ferric reductase
LDVLFGTWIFILGVNLFHNHKFRERVLRLIRGSAQTIVNIILLTYKKVKRVHALPSNVIYLELEKPGFYYKAGQYCFLNCPLISKYEWHPFTISSCPQQEFMSFHIRCVGDWSNFIINHKQTR